MLTEQLQQCFGAAVLGAETIRNEEIVMIDRERAPEILRALRDDPSLLFNVLTDLTAVDWPDRKPRFDVVYQLNSLTLGRRLRVKIWVEGPEPWVHTAIEIWKSADWLERECFDMFGVVFKGHPDLRRILMYDSFEGHPLRKDYPFQKRQPIVPEIDPVTNPIRSSR